MNPQRIHGASMHDCLYCEAPVVPTKNHHSRNLMKAIIYTNTLLTNLETPLNPIRRAALKEWSTGYRTLQNSANWTISDFEAILYTWVRCFSTLLFGELFSLGEFTIWQVGYPNLELKVVPFIGDENWSTPLDQRTRWTVQLHPITFGIKDRQVTVQIATYPEVKGMEGCVDMRVWLNHMMSALLCALCHAALELVHCHCSWCFENIQSRIMSRKYGGEWRTLARVVEKALKTRLPAGVDIDILRFAGEEAITDTELDIDLVGQ